MKVLLGLLIACTLGVQAGWPESPHRGAASTRGPVSLSVASAGGIAAEPTPSDQKPSPSPTSAVTPGDSPHNSKTPLPGQMSSLVR